MIQTFVNAFDRLWEIVVSAFEFLQHTIEEMITFFKMLPNIILIMNLGFGYLPTFLFGLAMIILFISLIMMILGRTIGGSS